VREKDHHQAEKMLWHKGGSMSEILALSVRWIHAGVQADMILGQNLCQNVAQSQRVQAGNWSP